MLIVCPNCATSYRVEPSSLGGAGRSVRCVRCRTVWFARDPNAIPAITQGFRSEITAFLPDQIADAAEAPADSPPPVALASLPLPGTDGAELDHILSEDLAAPELQSAEAAPFPVAESPIQDALPRFDAPIAIPGAADSVPMETVPFLTEATVGEDIETVAARRARQAARRRVSWPLPGLPTTIMALVALNAVLIGWRADVVKIAPQTASLYAAIGLPVNLRGLTFASIETTTETHDGVPVLVVEGRIVSAVARTVDVPRLRFSVRNQRGQEIYSWTALPSRSLLAPGETLDFRSRLASPPPEGRDVLVRFFNRRDLVAGLQ